MEVVGIGLANIDLVAHVDEDFLLQHHIAKGLAHKVDHLSFGRLRAALQKFDAIPGGCAANTMCGLATEGISTQFYGKIGQDSFDSLYRSSFHDYTVAYDVAAGMQESSQCAVLVTPDGERSFAYIDGASWDLAPEDIDKTVLEQSRLIYAEVYIFEFGKDRATARMVFESAQRSKIPLALKLNDKIFGAKYASNIKALSDAGTLSLLIGNAENLPSVTGADTLEKALEDFKTWKCQVLLTLGKDGCYFIAKGDVTHYPVTPVENPKNTVGAGDQFAAGFLTGWLDRRPVEDSVRHGEFCARVILNHDMARPPLVSKHSISF